MRISDWSSDVCSSDLIKLIKPGLLSETLVERFQHERQALADLGHPNIARLFDGGQTAEGLPYIVMEYVDGASLGDWLLKDKPRLDQRLDPIGRASCRERVCQ